MFSQIVHKIYSAEKSGPIKYYNGFMSRKTKLTKNRWEILTNAVKYGYTISDACEMAHIGRSTYYKWLSDYPDLNKVIVEATDLQWKYADWRSRYDYRGYERRNLNRPSLSYSSPNNLPFDITEE